MKKIKVLLVCMVSAATMYSCGGDADKKVTVKTDGTETTTTATDVKSGDDYDPKRGLGNFDESNVDVSSFNKEMADAGKQIAEVKCTSCHKTTEERLVGPGWKGVTERQTPHWIMNFITNPDPMIDVDPELQSQLELCLVRMPNQGLSDTDAREILEYMREIDGAK